MKIKVTDLAPYECPLMQTIDVAGWASSLVFSSHCLHPCVRLILQDSTRMKNSVVGLDVDEQNEGKSTKVHTLLFPLSSVHVENGTRKRPTRHQYYPHSNTYLRHRIGRFPRYLDFKDMSNFPLFSLLLATYLHEERDNFLST